LSLRPFLSLVYIEPRHETVIRGFLWTLLALVVLALVVNGFILGPAVLAFRVLAPIVVFGAVVGWSLWLSYRRRTGLAIALVVGLVLLSVGIRTFLAGGSAPGSALVVLFVPIVLVGLLQHRGALFLTGAASILVALVPPALHELGLWPTPLGGTLAWGTVLQFTVVLGIVTFFFDRFGSALHDALRLSSEREVALLREAEERRRAIDELSVARDQITELNDHLRTRLEHITALREIDRAIIASHDVDRTLRVILAQVTRQLGIDAGRIHLVRPGEGSMRLGAQRGFRVAAGRSSPLGSDDEQAGIVARDRVQLIITDPATFRRRFRRAPHVLDEGFTGYAAVPLIAKGQLHGVLELFQRSPFEPGDEWLSTLDALATQFAIALNSVTMLDDLERSNDELLRAYDTSIEGWSRALDLRDKETEGHSRRVTDMTLRLATAVGIPDDELLHVRRGALLHDIGKMGVPDAILLKPGPLTEEEWRLMRRHPTLAYELLSPIAFFGPALDIPYAHHERWDGGGYPRGLVGDQIPISARIFAVADVYDALTSDRPYRRAWSPERTLDHIRCEAGRHFDPQVVEPFVRMLKDPVGRSV
jgi:HD-GYP domain-containing protein (c-di-GMP phosphodiesterase class II)